MSALERRPGPSQAQLAAMRKLRPQASTQTDATMAPGGYAGLVTRTLAFALDALIIDVVAAFVGVTVGLGVSLLHLPHDVDVAIGAVLGAAFILWSIGYFVFFWSSTGQTPGSRVMHIRVIGGRATGGLKPRRALLRVIGLFLAALPLLAGLWMMLWDDRSRCLQDRIARTVVVYT
jgi:uncharacterized RDD family membrane protein YckC